MPAAGVPFCATENPPATAADGEDFHANEEPGMSAVRITGGCQCGAVRYALHAQPTNPCICYCRMCQKQFGNLFGSFAGVRTEEFEATRGEIAWFRSSDDAERGFCRDCGTPLAYRYRDRPRISMALGSLDEPEKIKPVFQYGVEGRVPWLAEVLMLPATVTGAGDVAERYDGIRQTNRQHPDHDTAVWPPA
jgi:hypothetical protein